MTNTQEHNHDLYVVVVTDRQLAKMRELFPKQNYDPLVRKEYQSKRRKVVQDDNFEDDDLYHMNELFKNHRSKPVSQVEDQSRPKRFSNYLLVTREQREELFRNIDAFVGPGEPFGYENTGHTDFEPDVAEAISKEIKSRTESGLEKAVGAGESSISQAIGESAD